MTAASPLHIRTYALAPTRALLTAGLLAGPLFLVVGFAQAFTRPGFDLTRHPLSLLANGPLSWVQIANLIVAGLFTLAGAVGLRRALAPGLGRAWGPLLIGVYGLSLVAAGIFTADPALGFPPGTPETGNPVSWHGLLHFISGALGFLALIAACLVFARRFATQRRTGWAAFSLLTGLLFFAAFAGIASGGGQPLLNLAFTGAVILAWTWLSALAAHARQALA